MNDILVIGNGYDVALGYKTQYKSFLEYTLCFKVLRGQNQLLIYSVKFLTKMYIYYTKTIVDEFIDIDQIKEEVSTYFHQKIRSKLFDNDTLFGDEYTKNRNNFVSLYNEVFGNTSPVKINEILQESFSENFIFFEKLSQEKKRIIQFSHSNIDELEESTRKNKRKREYFFFRESLNAMVKHGNNSILEYFEKGYLEEQFNGENWVDFEREIYEVVHEKNLDIFKQNRAEFNDFKKCFANYLEMITQGRKKKSALPSEVINNSVTYLITFNYTRTYKDIIKYNVVQHIHGESTKGVSKIVLGIDGIDDEIKNSELSPFMYLTKASQMIPYKNNFRIDELNFDFIEKKMTSNDRNYIGKRKIKYPIYKLSESTQLESFLDLSEGIQEPLRIVFYGFSFGLADKSKIVQILKPFFEFPKILHSESKIIVYAYQYEDAEDIWTNIESIFRSVGKRIERDFFEIIVINEK